ncbi:serine O-acetyltransferase [Zavarzinia compransoris]|uniref:Serine acetyltransferase n=1 Tax=Zavarzinia compransoris TaxID=1264899 RepID=A0A317E1P0_9PROT|nr:serine O-acetyltransferase [Zavarzinia compransoris]PWR20046.1 serine O-acetyltransferase [Zavarzinia compransoris]TDP44833.1 serine O-acetyltransferase [Zavarzinia compransoris]
MPQRQTLPTPVTVLSRDRGPGAPADVWAALVDHAGRIARGEPLLAPLARRWVLGKPDFAAALGAMLADKVSGDMAPRDTVAEVIAETLLADPVITAATLTDLAAILDRDPAVKGAAHPFLFFKGFQALQVHRIAHHLWQAGRHDAALFFQSRAAEVFAVDIHPAAPLGTGVMLDHGTGLVVGETASIGNNVSILQKVTLGGTGKTGGDRHPKVRDGVLLSAGATILGNIEIGRNAKVGAGSVVLHDVPAYATVAGVPAKVVGWCKQGAPALSMDHDLPEE